MRDIGAVILIIFCMSLFWPDFIGETAGKIVAAYNLETKGGDEQ